jgi:hypothetical protein
MASNSSVNNWRENADCRGKDIKLFFEGYETDEQIAKDIDALCFGCPVQQQCLKMGLATSGTGVHGGVYLSLGQLAKAKNAHKLAERIQELNDEIQDLRDELNDE